MNKSLTEHVKEMTNDFERVITDHNSWHTNLGVPNWDVIKSHLLLSQLKTIELLKEAIKEMDEEKARVASPDHPDYMFSLAQFNRVAGVNQMVRQAITLLDTIIQNIKSQIK